MTRLDRIREIHAELKAQGHEPEAMGALIELADAVADYVGMGLPGRRPDAGRSQTEQEIALSARRFAELRETFARTMLVE